MLVLVLNSFSKDDKVQRRIQTFSCGGQIMWWGFGGGAANIFLFQRLMIS